MPEAQARFDHIIAKLREQGHRLTSQRLALVRLIAESEGHPLVPTTPATSSKEFG